MNQSLNKWFIVVALAIAAFFVFISLLAIQQYNIGYRQGQADFQPQVITETITVPAYYELSANTTTITVAEALAIITLAKAPHAYYGVLHPELQNASTGNTSVNLEWMENYDRVSNVIKALANKPGKE